MVLLLHDNGQAVAKIIAVGADTFLVDLIDGELHNASVVLFMSFSDLFSTDGIDLAWLRALLTSAYQYCTVLLLLSPLLQNEEHDSCKHWRY